MDTLRRQYIMRLVRTVFRFAGALILVLSLACGYKFTPVGGVVPQGTKTIAIPVFLNGTLEPSIDIEATRAVVEEFMSDGRLHVVGTDVADIILHGKITKFEVAPASYTVDYYVQSYNVVIGVALTVEDARNRSILLQDKGLGTVFNSNYAVSIGDVKSTKIAKGTALKNASRDLASSIRSRILEGF